MIGKNRLSNLPDASRVDNLRLVQCHSVDWRLIAAIFCLPFCVAAAPAWSRSALSRRRRGAAPPPPTITPPSTRSASRTRARSRLPPSRPRPPPAPAVLSGTRSNQTDGFCFIQNYFNGYHRLQPVGELQRNKIGSSLCADTCCRAPFVMSQREVTLPDTDM